MEEVQRVTATREGADPAPEVQSTQRVNTAQQKDPQKVAAARAGAAARKAKQQKDTMRGSIHDLYVYIYT